MHAMRRLDSLLWSPSFRSVVLRNAMVLANADSNDWPVRCAVRYRHRLHDAFLSNTQLCVGDPVERLRRTRQEATLVSEFWPFAADCIRRLDAEGLASLTLRINHAIGEAGRPRACAVGNVPDRAGVQVVFVESNQVGKELGRLCLSLCHIAQQSPGFTYCQALAALGHLHPFADGNGRTARILASSLLSSAVGTTSYLASGVLAEHNLPAWVMSVREAAYFGDYAALANLVTATIECLAERPAEPTGASPSRGDHDPFP